MRNAARGRLLAKTLLLLVLSGAVFLVGMPAFNTSRAFAQQEEGKEAPPEKKAEEPVPDDTHFLLKLFSNLISALENPFVTLIFLLIFAMSVFLVTIVILLALDLRMPVAIPPPFVEEFTQMVNKRQFKQAYELCRNDSSFLAQVLSSGMSRLQYGIDDAREAAFNMVESLKAGKDNLINYVGTIGTLGPMVGLVGTVVGMIKSFTVIGTKTTPSANQLAGGISTALVLTFLGIFISVPAIFAFSFFKNRLTRVGMEVSNLSDDLLTQMYHNSKKAAPAGTPIATPAPGQQTTG